ARPVADGGARAPTPGRSRYVPRQVRRPPARGGSAAVGHARRGGRSAARAGRRHRGGAGRLGAGRPGTAGAHRRSRPATRRGRTMMRIATGLQYGADPTAGADEVAGWEDAGLDMVWVSEAYGFDAVSIMGYLAAKTERMQIGSAILPIYSRTPALLAQTAAGLDAVSGGRAVLGIGASGPQVIEGWHGVAYD